MDITLSNLIHNSGQNFLIVAPVAKQIAGGNNSAILLHRFEYWFAKYADGFYKFIEPNDNYACNQGDTWTEEVGMSRKVFNKAFDLIGVRYKSKSAFEAASDKFQGKLYASYHDRRTNKTFYFRNHNHVNSVFTKFQALLGAAKTELKPVATKPQQQGRSSNGQNGHSYIEQRSTNNIPPNPPIQTSEEPAGQGGDFILEVWNGYLPDKLQKKFITPKIQRQLHKLIATKLDNNPEKWKNMCREISNSDFLMGKTSCSQWQINLEWLAKESNFDKILQGKYRINPEKIMKVELHEQDLTAQIDARDESPEVKAIRKQILQRSGANTYKSWFADVQIEWSAGQGAVIVNANDFWISYVENQFRWLKELRIVVLRR